MALQPGDVVLHYLEWPGKKKYFICVDPEKNLYACINSEPRRKTPEANVEVTRKDVGALRYTSHIDTAKPWGINPELGISTEIVGHLSDELKKTICNNVEDNKHVSVAWKDIIQKNLGSNQDGSENEE